MHDTTGENEMAERETGGKRSRLLANFPLGWQFFFPLDSLDFLARATIVGKFSQSILRENFFGAAHLYFFNSL